jgi:histidyl-tRNA synthetase
MPDWFPEVVEHWQRVEAACRAVFAAYGYREVRLPVVEKTELFARSIGVATDIVEKEMYTFEDRNGESLTLRPEGTAGCARAGIQHGILHNQTPRFWYAGPMFRHERPQKGRYRQFYQIGTEAFGMPGPDIDAEQLMMIARLWRELDVEGLELHLNTLGTLEARTAYRDVLVHYLEQRRDALDEDSLRRLYKNPLRVLDSKNPDMAEIIAGAPKLHDHLDEVSRAHFDRLRELLDAAGVAYTVNPLLVRGLDYYSHTVYEWVTDRLGAQGTVCAGGRYDGLVEELGGRTVPAIGFALGMERLVELLMSGAPEAQLQRPDIFVVMMGDRAQTAGMVAAETLRNQGWRVLSNCGGGSLKSQMKRADKSGAIAALILGEDEIERGEAALKPLRIEAPQQTVTMADLPASLRALIGEAGPAENR